MLEQKRQKLEHEKVRQQEKKSEKAKQTDQKVLYETHVKSEQFQGDLQKLMLALKQNIDSLKQEEKPSQSVEFKQEEAPKTMVSLLALQQQILISSRPSNAVPNIDDRVKEATSELIERILIKMNLGKIVLLIAEEELLINTEPDLLVLSIRSIKFKRERIKI